MPDRRKKATLKKVTLKSVYLLALDKKKFLNALLKDPEKALYGARLRLSPGDLKKLKRLLRSAKGKTLARMLTTRYRVLGRDLVRFMMTGGAVPKVTKPWPPPPWSIKA
jgi:hypothetical protein